MFHATYHRINGELLDEEQLLVFGVNVQMLKDQLGQHGR